MSIQAFVWNKRFETGLSSVDEQHRRLFELINRLGDLLMKGAADELAAVIGELRTYARFHFADEERLWQQGCRNACLDAKALAAHLRRHAEFIDQLDRLWLRGDSVEAAERLYGFLSAWLVYHILGEDRGMAEAVTAGVAGGRPPAFVPAVITDSEQVLLSAVGSLYHALSAMNTDLARANASLEARVAERTAALAAANAQLEEEKRELRATLASLGEARSRLLQNEKMASIGQLAAGVAHEINNPIGFVSSNLAALGEYMDDLLTVLDAYAEAEPLIAMEPQAIGRIRELSRACDLPFIRDDMQKLLAESREGIARVKGIVQDLRVFTHVDGNGRQPTDLRACLESTLNLTANELHQKAEVRREYGELPLLECNPGQINQVLMNLLVNAAQAIESQGVITVRTGADETWGWVEVEDNGRGIPVEHQERIFEPFFTTKGVGEGTGLGLSLSWNIIEQHGGIIGVDSAPGRGSRFRVSLPLPTGERRLPAGVGNNGEEAHG